MRTTASLALLSLSLAAAVAHADEAAPNDFRSQLIVADAASWGVLIAGLATKSPAVGGIGAGGMVLGAPIIHFANGDDTGAWESLGLRVGLSTVGAFVGFAAAGNSSHNELVDSGREGGMAVGLLAGMVTAQILDWTLVGHRSSGPGEKGPTSSFTLSPTLAATPMGGQIGAVGTF